MFKEGQAVWSVRKGPGKVMSTRISVVDVYSVEVRFGSDDYEYYTKEGRFVESDLFPELYLTPPFIPTVKKEAWVLFFKDPTREMITVCGSEKYPYLYISEREANEDKKGKFQYVGPVKIEWEEKYDFI